ncbi:uncharacterized protein LOC114292894 [Camellia sinensis]|uniref:uncharacterized protein LOC114292894 n=1 Tax=Camellia sinensis TaxID=4442 RepID=UPI00103692A2|nr:uncharacterized protein LOC114292894 [Camellia sinensis]
MEDERDWGPKLFRVLNAWFLHKDFQKFWELSWKEPSVVGWAGFILFQKLKRLKGSLGSWNVEVFGNVQNKLKAAEGELHNFDILAEDGELDGAEKVRRSEVRAEIWRLSRMVERLWLQKSRLTWAMKGDKNTRYFHVVAKGRTIRNEINSILDGEVVVEDPGQVKCKVFDHFKNQYTKHWSSRLVLGGCFSTVIGRGRSGWLESDFPVAEIKSAVMDCDGNKAPRSDGFNLMCYQKFWKVMKGDVVQFVKEF